VFFEKTIKKKEKKMHNENTSIVPLDPESNINNNNSLPFGVDIKLKHEQELRFRLVSKDPVEVMLLSAAVTTDNTNNKHATTTSSGHAEWCGSPLGSGVRYRVSPMHVRVAIFTWTGCTIRVFCKDAETFSKMEPYVAASNSCIGWHNSVMELHAQLHEARQKAAKNSNSNSNNNNNTSIGPCIVIAGAPASGRHQLATSLANLCVRSGGGACTVCDLDPIHQSCGSGVPLTIGASVWETSRIIDDSTTAHAVNFSLATGKPFCVDAVLQQQQNSNNAASASVGGHSNALTLNYAYVGAVTKLLRLVRQRVESQSNTRAGWSGSIIVLPRIESAGCCGAYASLLYRVCEVARADKLVLVGTGGGTRSVLQKLQQEYIAGHGNVVTSLNNQLLLTRQLRGATLSCEVFCMGSNPSSLVPSEMARTRMQDASIVLNVLSGISPNVPLDQVPRKLPISAIDIAILRTDQNPQNTSEVVYRVSAEQFKVEAESRLVAFYSSLHDCTNFVQPLGYGVIVEVDLGTQQQQQMMMMGQNKSSTTNTQTPKEVIVRTGRLTLPANLSELGSTLALVAIPGVVVQL
jgi:hypothetical protein